MKYNKRVQETLDRLDRDIKLCFHYEGHEVHEGKKDFWLVEYFLRA